MTLPYQAVFLIAFGGPTSPDEIRPFLDRVLKGVSIPKERLEEVFRHYEAVGGRSPLNEITFRQARSLEEVLGAKGLFLPVYVGFRNSHPFLAEALTRMNADGIREALAFILSSHQADASWQLYQRNVADAQAKLGNRAPQVDYCPGWHAHPLFIQTWREQIQAALNLVDESKLPITPLVFTAHSLPLAMASRSPYVEQIEKTARLVSAELGHSRWSVAYQSRSGRPGDPWLEPDIGAVIRSLAGEAVREMVVAPIGFVCDHVEVLYDLDIEARKTAENLGMRFLRASCPNDHPTFTAMLADVVQQSLSAKTSKLQ